MPIAANEAATWDDGKAVGERGTTEPMGEEDEDNQANLGKRRRRNTDEDEEADTGRKRAKRTIDD